MEAKTFQLKMVPQFYWLVITMLPVFIFLGLLGFKLEDYIHQFTQINGGITFLLRGLFMFLIFKILEYITYPQCTITTTAEMININITKAGIGINKAEMQYNWTDLISFQQLLGRSNKPSFYLIFSDKKVINFKNNDAFYAYLKTNFAEKEV